MPRIRTPAGQVPTVCAGGTGRWGAEPWVAGLDRVADRVRVGQLLGVPAHLAGDLDHAALLARRGADPVATPVGDIGRGSGQEVDELGRPSPLGGDLDQGRPRPGPVEVQALQLRRGGAAGAPVGDAVAAGELVQGGLDARVDRSPGTLTRHRQDLQVRPGPAEVLQQLEQPMAGLRRRRHAFQLEHLAGVGQGDGPLVAAGRLDRVQGRVLRRGDEQRVRVRMHGHGPGQGTAGLEHLRHRHQHIARDVGIERDLARQRHQRGGRVRRRHLRVAHQGREVVILHVRYPVVCMAATRPVGNLSVAGLPRFIADQTSAAPPVDNRWRSRR